MGTMRVQGTVGAWGHEGTGDMGGEKGTRVAQETRVAQGMEGMRSTRRERGHVGTQGTLWGT